MQMQMQMFTLKCKKLSFLELKKYKNAASAQLWSQ